MSGYTPDEKLRQQQLRALRRQWLKDQELSPREPVLPPEATWPMDRFWDKFLANKSPWRNMVYKVYRKSMFIFTCVLIPAWIVHYYVKYHVATKPYAIVQSKPRIFPVSKLLILLLFIIFLSPFPPLPSNH
ncbi:NADH dehydrogenase [ubiquinone] 1 beta subcomplex subunit 6 isoform X1 [Callithrix jacchus]|uniref:NADH dehydrogenase [ubiquinone] 1 beta subcomplex subunit 6 isoform X1 n=1 Tax=Callithrix jacchus TaxID=9483 RepID=UPI0004F0BFCA|nr:NADH dehydrogenase [ubiquinone] 1 beta subcomplex subunit 6 isoform X1 [Callithrix jacchus]